MKEAYEDPMIEILTVTTDILTESGNTDLTDPTDQQVWDGKDMSGEGDF
jgi:hypothetical protein